MKKGGARIIEIPKVHEKRGKLAVIEKGMIPFQVKRVYYLYDIPTHAKRGGHAHKKQESFIVALSGSLMSLLMMGLLKNASC